MLFLAAVLYAWEDFLNACVVQSRASKVVEVTKRFSRTSLKSKLEFWCFEMARDFVKPIVDDGSYQDGASRGFVWKVVW